MTEFGESSYRRFLQGDPNALGELVHLYSDCLTRYAYLFVRNSAAAEDIMEDAFAALVVKRKKLPESVRVKAYLYAVTRNRAIDYLRANKRQSLPLTDFEEILRAEDTERAIADRARDRKVYECLNRLPTAYREALYFFYFDGYNVTDIAKLMKKSRKQVYNLLARAKAQLKDILLKEGFGNEDL